MPERREGPTHCQKKSRHGIATPKGDVQLIRERLKMAEAMARE